MQYLRLTFVPETNDGVNVSRRNCKKALQKKRVSRLISISIGRGAAAEIRLAPVRSRDYFINP